MLAGFEGPKGPRQHVIGLFDSVISHVSIIALNSKGVRKGIIFLRLHRLKSSYDHMMIFLYMKFFFISLLPAYILYSPIDWTNIFVAKSSSLAASI